MVVFVKKPDRAKRPQEFASERGGEVADSGVTVELFFFAVWGKHGKHGKHVGEQRFARVQKMNKI